MDLKTASQQRLDFLVCFTGMASKNYLFSFVNWFMFPEMLTYSVFSFYMMLVVGIKLNWLSQINHQDS